MPEAREADVDRAVEAAASRLRRSGAGPAMTATAARQAALPARRSRRRQCRQAGRARDARHRQDHPRDPRADRLCRRLLPLLRRPRRQDRRRASADRQARHGGLAAPRADRRRRRHRAVEHPALPVGRQDRSGARRRLHASWSRRPRTARRRCSNSRGWSTRPAFRRASSTSSPASAPACGAAPDQPSDGRAHRLHRRPGDGAPRRAQLGGEPRLHLARTRRQVARHRLRRRRSRKRRQRAGRRHLRRHRPELRRRLAADRRAFGQGRVPRHPEARRPKRSASATRRTWRPRSARSPRARQREHDRDGLSRAALAAGARLVTGGARAGRRRTASTSRRPSSMPTAIRPAVRARGALRTGAHRALLRHRGGGGRRSPTTRPSASPPASSPATSRGPPHDERHPRRHRLGQHLPRGLADRRRSAATACPATAAKAASTRILDYTRTKIGLAPHLGRSDPRSVRDALSTQPGTAGDDRRETRTKPSRGE